MEDGIEIVCEEPCLKAALPVAGRELRSLAATLRQGAAAFYKQGLVPAVPQNIVLALVTDRESAALNKDTMGVFGPTNILSYPGSSGMAAELALAVETMLRESVLYGQEPAAYLVRLLAHGMLHVCGMDHGEEMFALQDKLMQSGVQSLER